MPNAARIDERLSRHRSTRSTRPLVLLAIDDDELRATFAYELVACGFEVAMTNVSDSDDASADRHPDIIVAAVSSESGTGCAAARTSWSDPRLRGVPVVGLAANASGATRDRARRLGCAAVCLATCSGDALARGLRAVLDRAALLKRTANQALV